MLYEVEGDILLSRAQVIGHGVSANDAMNQGLSKILHENFPSMHKEFHHWCHQHHPKPGQVWLWQGLAETKIAHLIIKDGGYTHQPEITKTSSSHIKHALHALKKLAIKEKFSSIALPRLGTGIGGIDWAEVLPIIHYELSDLSIPVYVYSHYKPQKRAIEPH